MSTNKDATNIVLNWSSGKDAALSYHFLSQDERYNVAQLLTTINDEQDRVVMHGVRESLLDAQANRMNVPSLNVKLPPSPDHDIYNRVMEQTLSDLSNKGITHAAYGDIFLEDLKQYREQQLAKAGFTGVFPLWKKDTRALIQIIEEVGIYAKVVCVNEKVLGKEFLGRRVDTSFMNDLPDWVDPCGENGEFHTFVYNAPFFSKAIDIEEGEMVYKQYERADGSWDTGFYFLDIYEKQ